MEEILQTIVNRLFLNNQVYVKPLNDGSNFEVLYSRFIDTFDNVLNFEYEIQLVSNINKIEINVVNDYKNVDVNFIFNVSARENKYVDKNQEDKILVTYYVSSIKIVNNKR